MEGLTAFLQVGGFLIAMLTIYRGLSEYGKSNSFTRAGKMEQLIDKFKEEKLSVAKRIMDDFVEDYYEGVDLTKQGEATPANVDKDMTIVGAKIKTLFWTSECVNGTWEDSVKDLPDSDKALLTRAKKALIKVKKFTFISLAHLLRDHRTGFVSVNEIYFRDSFDELLDFYSLLIYYLRNEIITIREVRAHFLPHLQAVRRCGPVLDYIQIYYPEQDFDWLFKQLPDPVATSQTKKMVVERDGLNIDVTVKKVLDK